MLTSTSNPKVKQITALLQKAKERREKDAFVIEGTKLFEEVPLPFVQEVYVTESFLEKQKNTGRSDLLEKLQRTGYETVSEQVFERFSDTKTPQGILAVVRQRHYQFEELLGSRPMLLLLEDIQDPGNLGTMFRAGEGAGMTGVILTRETVDPYAPKTIRSTMGSIFRMPFLVTENLQESIAALQKKKIAVYAAHLKGDHSYDELDYTQGCAFLIGNEGNGLRDETAAAADAYMKIPMKGSVESLNASVAASVLLYEAARQRRKH